MSFVTEPYNHFNQFCVRFLLLSVLFSCRFQNSTVVYIVICQYSPRMTHPHPLYALSVLQTLGFVDQVTRRSTWAGVSKTSDPVIDLGPLPPDRMISLSPQCQDWEYS